MAQSLDVPSSNGKKINRGVTARVAAADGNIEWPCQAVQKFVGEIKTTESSALKRSDDSGVLDTKSKSLLDVKKLTVHMEDVEAGKKDIAELRSDYTGSYYSNFTTQHCSLPGCIGRCSLVARYWSFTVFMLSALHQLLFNSETTAMALGGLVSTFLCSEDVLDFRATYQTSVLFIGLIFPMVFLIGQTWARREKAVERLAVIKGNALQLIMKLVAHRDSDYSCACRVASKTKVLIEDIGKFLPQDAMYSGLRLSHIYGHFADLQTEPECAMLTRFMLCEFEKLRTQRDYRTPWKLNYFCFFFGSIAPALCGPLFASMGCKDRFPARTSPVGETCGYGTPGAYISAIFFAIVVSALLTIVKAMEDPFSLSGPDDVISSFAFECNAILTMMEERHPGCLKEVADRIDWNEWNPREVRTLSDAAVARMAASVKQGAVDDHDDSDADGGLT